MSSRIVDQKAKIRIPANILVVDDYSANRKLLRAVLEGEGFHIVEAADGVEALAALDREPIDAIISDILMPRMDGYRLCLEVRKNEKHKTIPIIIYTSTYTSPGDERCALDSGADKYIRKPAPAQTMLDALDELLKGPSVRAIQPASTPKELEVMREYSEALIRKLEEKNRELERAKADITIANQELEARVHERTSQLEEANNELEAFSHSVAHDLRNPLSVILGCAHLLKDYCEDKFTEPEKKYLRKIEESAVRMEALITDLLKLSQGTRAVIQRSPVDASALAQKIVQQLQETSPGRKVELSVAPGVVANADTELLRIALENLLANAWKFTAKKARAHIDFGVKQDAKHPVYFVRDNGAGFDMAKAENLFSAFQRLHDKHDFPGTGIGLTTVERIIRRHGGEIWAESVPNQETTFYFTLPPPEKNSGTIAKAGSLKS